MGWIWAVHASSWIPAVHLFILSTNPPLRLRSLCHGKDVSLTKKIDLFGSERRFPLPGVAKKKEQKENFEMTRIWKHIRRWNQSYVLQLPAGRPSTRQHRRRPESCPCPDWSPLPVLRRPLVPDNGHACNGGRSFQRRAAHSPWDTVLLLRWGRRKGGRSGDKAHYNLECNEEIDQRRCKRLRLAAAAPSWVCTASYNCTAWSDPAPSCTPPAFSF